MRRVARIVPLLLALGACGEPALPGELTGRHQAGGVTVDLSVRAGTLTATFTPLEGYHLYSKDMPDDGVDGIGFPTVAQPGAALTAVGPATADREVTELHVTGIDLTLPVYPDGPVTLTVPVRATGSDRYEVTVGYAACSTRSCLAPVTGERVTLHTID
ncbi:protein-disulfide reductase DsbD domain-containing protein [Actinoplanes palleronii]|uniref:Thiol:disulfide interchange protein DsbD N-terminal domain-containing protein n=1 Tax=Actinoplanes palleronii TaxID=113570 RepID=A0ABQ4B2W9_9ACTN|nr:protein-disulfide reductase DsbD domain-containing protein [Actinoplanes palleronii]GIE65023.1 hypothetical protein Apa02nite_011310 [Actinoplanes palleronii]